MHILFIYKTITAMNKTSTFIVSDESDKNVGGN